MKRLLMCEVVVRITASALRFPKWHSTKSFFRPVFTISWSMAPIEILDITAGNCNRAQCNLTQHVDPVKTWTKALRCKVLCFAIHVLPRLRSNASGLEIMQFFSTCCRLQMSNKFQPPVHAKYKPRTCMADGGLAM
jgi:hypothetical protein